MKKEKKKESGNAVHMHLKLNKITDADILDALDRSGNKQGYIKLCIRKHLKG